MTAISLFVVAASVIERAECGLQPLHRIIASGVVEAFIVDAADAEHRSEVAGFRKKCVLVPKPLEVQLRGKRACLFPILRNVVSPEHCDS